MKEELILRDRLAMDRTILANERTLLSYLRTALAIVVVGFTLMHFFTDPAALSGGILLIFAGVAILIVGIVRTRRMSREIQRRR